MPVDYEATLARVQSLIVERCPATAAWQEVVKLLSPQVSAAAHARMLSIDVDAEIDRLEVWLNAAIEESPIPSAIRGLRFGLFHPMVDGEPSCDIYLAGSRDFDLDSHGWGFDRAFYVETKPQCAALHTLYPVSCDDPTAADQAVVCVGLWFSMLSLAELCRRNGQRLLGTRRRLGVGVGFDSGDLISLGYITTRGFIAQRPIRKRVQPKRPHLIEGSYFRMEGIRDSMCCKYAGDDFPRDFFQTRHELAVDHLRAAPYPRSQISKTNSGSLSPFGCLILTAEIAQALRFVGRDDLQLIPLSIEGRSERWMALHVRKILNGYDNVESHIQSRFVLRHAVIAGSDLFFLRNYYEWSCLFVSRRVAQALIDYGIRDICFIPMG